LVSEPEIPLIFLLFLPTMAKPASVEPFLEKSLVRNGSFWLLMAAQISEQIADSLNFIVLLAAFLVVFDGNLPRATQWVVLPTVLAVPLFGAIAGVFVDRVSKRSLLLAAAVGRGALISGLAWLSPYAMEGSMAATASMVGLIFLISTLWQFYNPARSAALPEVVAHDRLDLASSISITVMLIMQIFGYFAGGLLGDNVDPALLLWVNAACYLVTLIFVFFIRFHEPEAYPFEKLSYRSVQKELVQSLKELLSPRMHLRGALVSVVVLVLAVGLAFPNLKDFTASLKFPPVMDHLDAWLLDRWTLKVGPLTRFTLLLFMGGFGAGVGIACLSWLKRHVSQVVLIQAALGVCALFLFLLPEAHSFGRASLYMAGAGLGGMLVIALTEARIQRKIPPHLRGKVLSAYFMARGGAVLGAAAIPGMYQQFFERWGGPLAPLVWIRFSGWMVLAFAILNLVSRLIWRRTEVEA
jgi:MFS family permease